MQQAFTPSAKPVHNAALLPQARSASHSTIASPMAAPPIIAASAEARRVREQEIVTQARQKSLAFAEFYKSPASCEHPIDWTGQVECGNQYIRAKRAFDLKWATEHPSSEQTK